MKYIVKRILQMIPSVLLVLLITFTLSRIVPGDPARMMAGEQAPEEAVERIREEMGLNDPIPKQFVDYVGTCCTGIWARPGTPESRLHTISPCVSRRRWSWRCAPCCWRC